MKIHAIIGLGNPGKQYENTRHNIGFRVIDALAEEQNLSWQTKDSMDLSRWQLSEKTILLIKPQTFMNSSGEVVPFLQKQGITPEEVLVIHDELELAFGKVALKKGGSAKGHNGLKSIISFYGAEFYRLRCGIGRPEDRNDVPRYVLSSFNEPKNQVTQLIQEAVALAQELSSDQP